jgi:DNA-binding MarR family transcriptional regulator
MAQPATPLFSPIHLLHRDSQRADGLFARRTSDLTPRQFVVLQAVAGKNGLSETDIMAATGIDRSSTAELVRTLVTNGCLKQRRTRRDARVYAVRNHTVRPADAGDRLSATGAAEEELLLPVPEKQRSVLLKLLTLQSTPRSDEVGRIYRSRARKPWLTEGSLGSALMSSDERSGISAMSPLIMNAGCETVTMRSPNPSAEPVEKCI